MSSTFTRSAARCTSQPQVPPAHIRSYQSRDKPSLQAGSFNRWTPFLDDRRFRIRSLIGSSAGEFSPIIRYVTVSARTGLASRCLLSLTMLLLPTGCSVVCTVRRHTRAILHLAHAETLGFRDRQADLTSLDTTGRATSGAASRGSTTLGFTCQRLPSHRTRRAR